MKTTALLATLAILALPNVVAAACSGHAKTAQMSCAEGTIYDVKTESCIPITG